VIKGLWTAPDQNNGAHDTPEWVASSQSNAGGDWVVEEGE
jgi:hypothetical protein